MVVVDGWCGGIGGRGGCIGHGDMRVRSVWLQAGTKT